MAALETRWETRPGRPGTVADFPAQPAHETRVFQIIKLNPQRPRTPLAGKENTHQGGIKNSESPSKYGRTECKMWIRLINIIIVYTAIMYAHEKCENALAKTNEHFCKRISFALTSRTFLTPVRARCVCKTRRRDQENLTMATLSLCNVQ